MGVLLHVMGDAANNLGVMAAALVIWLTHYEGRYYADPGTSMGIGIMIILTSLPLSMYLFDVSGGRLLTMNSAPLRSHFTGEPPQWSQRGRCAARFRIGNQDIPPIRSLSKHKLTTTTDPRRPSHPRTTHLAP